MYFQLYGNQKDSFTCLSSKMNYAELTIIKACKLDLMNSYVLLHFHKNHVRDPPIFYQKVSLVLGLLFGGQETS